MTDIAIDDDSVLGRLVIDHKLTTRHRRGHCRLCEYWRMVLGVETWNGRAHRVPAGVFEAWIGKTYGRKLEGA